MSDVQPAERLGRMIQLVDAAGSLLGALGHEHRTTPPPAERDPESPP